MFISFYVFREYQNIVSDRSRAERFGLLMLSDDEEEKEGFEDIDLDKLSNEEDAEDNDIDSSCEKLSNLQHLLANYMEGDHPQQRLDDTESEVESLDPCNPDLT